MSLKQRQGYLLPRVYLTVDIRIDKIFFEVSHIFTQLLPTVLFFNVCEHSADLCIITKPSEDCTSIQENLDRMEYYLAWQSSVCNGSWGCKLVNHKLSMNSQCDVAAKNVILGCISKTIASKSQEAVVLLYTVLDIPHLGVQFWVPQFKNKQKQVQRRVTQFSLSKKWQLCVLCFAIRNTLLELTWLKSCKIPVANYSSCRCHWTWFNLQLKASSLQKESRLKLCIV